MIRMPRQHIADNVAERIMAVEKKFSANQVLSQGQRLEAALTQPVGDVAPLEGIEDALVGRSLGL